MKKYLSLFILTIVILGTVGCGKDESSESSSETILSSVEATTSSLDNEDTPATVEDTTVDTLNIGLDSNPNFTYGYLTLCIGRNVYAYNLEENRMFECDAFDHQERRINFSPCPDGKIAVCGDKKQYQYNVFNLETGEVIASREVNGLIPLLPYLDVNSNVQDYLWGLNSGIPVIKIEEDFSGDKVYFGIIGKDGNWVLPLSDNYAICKEKGEEIKNGWGYPNLICGSSLVRYSDDCYYDYIEDKFINADDICKKTGQDCIITAVGDNLLMGIGGDLCIYSELIRYNIRTGESTVLYDEPLQVTDVDRMQSVGLFMFKNDENNTYRFLDKNLNKLDYNFDLSSYDNVEIIDVNEDRVVFFCNNPDGNRYIAVVGKEGKLVFDPIKFDFPGDDITVIGDQMIIYSHYDNVDCFIINCNNGEIKPYESGYIKRVDSSSHTMLVMKDYCFYISNIDNPDSLINPFEQ